MARDRPSNRRQRFGGGGGSAISGSATIYLEQVLDRVGELADPDTKGMVFKAAMSAVDEELVNASNGHSLEGPLSNVIVNYSFTEGRQEAVEKALLDLVLTDPEGITWWLQRFDDGGVALTTLVRETPRAND